MENKKKIIEQSKKRSLKFGGFSLAFIVVIISIVFALNLFVVKFDKKIDLTDQKVFTLTKETKDILNTLDEEVTITILEKAGSDSTTTSRIVGKYGDETKKIKVDYIDPELNPSALEKYEENSAVTFGSLIIESEGKVQTLSPIDLLGLTEAKDKVKEIKTETVVTNAILNVTAKGEKTILTIQGHGEKEFNKDILKGLTNENFVIEEINLLTDTLEPDEDQVLMINSLKKDISLEEANKLKEYVENKGKVLIIDDLYEVDRKNYENILEQNGIIIERSIVFENNMSHRINSDKFIQIPTLGKHEIVDVLNEKNYKAVIAYGQPIEVMHVKKDNLIMDPLLISSNESYSKDSKVIKESRTTAQEGTDAMGPFNLAVAISRRIDAENHPSMIVYSNSFFLNESFIANSNGANLDMFINSLHWLFDSEEEMIIRPKDVTSSPVNINNFQQIIVSIFSIFVIPLTIGLSGFYYWFRRQKM